MLDQFGNDTEEYYGYVYLIYDQKRNLIYIGHKKGKIENSKEYFGSGTLIRRIQKKRGTYFLKKTILGVCYSYEELIECETECKFFFNAFDIKYGYNILEKDTGGDTFTNNPNKEKLREQHKQNALNGITLKNKGRDFSEKYRKNLSIAGSVFETTTVPPVFPPSPQYKNKPAIKRSLLLNFPISFLAFL